MAAYFLAAVGMPLVKIGHSNTPVNRLNSMQVWSPVKLDLVAWDEDGDALTEAELLYRFRHLSSHGEWVFRSDEVDAVIRETKASGRIPGGWYASDEYHAASNSYPSCMRGPLAQDLWENFGLSLNEIRSLIGAQVGQTKDLGLALAHVPVIVEHLMASGKIKHYSEVMIVPSNKRKAA